MYYNPRHPPDPLLVGALADYLVHRTAPQRAGSSAERVVGIRRELDCGTYEWKGCYADTWDTSFSLEMMSGEDMTHDVRTV